MSMPSVFADVLTKLFRILLFFHCLVLGRLFRRGSVGLDGGYILGDSGARDQGMYREPEVTGSLDTVQRKN